MNPPFLTIFTTPKPFTNSHIDVIQNNALLTWVNLGKEVEVLLVGEEEGVAKAAAHYGIRYLPQVKRNSSGTPLISSMFDLAKKNSKSPFLAIINTDILLLPDLITTLKIVSAQFEKFVVAGQRWDLDVKERFRFSKDLYAQLALMTRQSGCLHSPMGSDYFIFPRECYPEVPDFAIGRAGWDNWMLFKSRWEGWPLIDASDDIMVIHQTHDYSHLTNGQPHYRLPETKQNVVLAGGDQTIFTLMDATHKIFQGQIRLSTLTLRKFLREVEIIPLTKWHSRLLGLIFYYFFHPKKGYQSIRGWLKKQFSG
jgi:hypothetical protein